MDLQNRIGNRQSEPGRIWMGEFLTGNNNGAKLTAVAELQKTANRPNPPISFLHRLSKPPAALRFSDWQPLKGIRKSDHTYKPDRCTSVTIAGSHTADRGIACH
jgi:hypothetical protein